MKRNPSFLGAGPIARVRKSSPKATPLCEWLYSLRRLATDGGRMWGDDSRSFWRWLEAKAFTNPPPAKLRTILVETFTMLVPKYEEAWVAAVWF